MKFKQHTEEERILNARLKSMKVDLIRHKHCSVCGRPVFYEETVCGECVVKKGREFYKEVQ